MNEQEKPKDLKDRTRDLALRIIRLYAARPKSRVAQVIGDQLLRCGTSVGANFREGIRARSRKEYATKLHISLMELEESLYWIELLEAAAVFTSVKLGALKKETSELTAIFVMLIKRAKQSKSWMVSCFCFLVSCFCFPVL